MGRLSPLSQRARFMALGPLLLATIGCEDNQAAPIAPQSRAAAVQAKTPPPNATAGTPPSDEPKAEEPPRPELCKGQMSGKGTDLPALDISRAGAPQPPAAIEVGGGKWTWINFWAAWCVPCKQEIPLLREWERELSGSLRLQFVSLDDDERQLRDFLKAQPASGVQATYWLRDGKERQEWLAEVGMDPDPELPAHVLVDPEGKIRCRIGGAIEESDRKRVGKLVGG